MFPAHPHTFRAVKLLLGALIILQARSTALTSTGETCYSRQHRDTIVNVRKALDHQKTIMDVRKKEAERDCILACCSEELKPGIKCNMVVYKPQSQEAVENCYLFHCETEQDCPLMTAKLGTNTYDIFKGLTHPSTKVKEREPTVPFTITKQPSTTQSTSTTMEPRTTTTLPTTTTSTTQSSTTTALTTANTSTIVPTDLAIILLTMPVEIMPTVKSTTTLATQSLTTTTKVPSMMSTTTTAHPVQPPQPPPNPIRSFRKQVRPPKKPEPHGKPNAKEAEIPNLQKQATQKTMIPATAITSTTSTTPSTTTTTTPSTTTTTTPSTTTTTTPSTTTSTTPSTTTTTTTSTTTTTTTSTTTTTPPPTTTTTNPSTTTTTIPTTTTTTTTTTSSTSSVRTTIVIVEMENDLKNGESNLKPPGVASTSNKTKESHLMWKDGLAFTTVISLIFLTFVVATACRRAVETFDRRHYTRLELNDLHYEI